VSRAPVAAFVALVIATIGAFFVTQHLKVTTPLIAGDPIPFPSTINPVNGGTCVARTPRGTLASVNFRRMKVSFYLLNRADDVDVYIVDHGTVVATLPGSGRHLRIRKRRLFTWNGREDDGRIAPDGVYDIQVSLVHQGRAVTISNSSTGAVEPVTVQTRPPDLRVTGVSPAMATGAQRITIHYAGSDGLRPRIWIYRVGAGGAARPVKSYDATTDAGVSVWDGLIHGQPAPPGTYLIGLKLKDRTCNEVQYPTPPTTAAAPHAVVTVN
jgi:hypothetical protein